MKTNKISIIWISATGKTCLSHSLSEIYKLPIVHCDEFWWWEDWSENSEEFVIKKIEKELQENKWIIEGYINPLTKERLQESDIVYYLDYSWFTALFWYLKRYWKYRKSPRPEMKKWSEEKLDFAFMKTILIRAERNEIEHEVQGFDSKILRFCSHKELDSHIYELRKSIT